MKKLLLLLTVWVCVLTSRADSTVFDTFGPGETVYAGSGYIVGGGVNSAAVESAARFIAETSGTLATIDLALTPFLDLPPAIPVQAFLYGETGGLPDNSNQIFLGTTGSLVGTSVLTLNVVDNVSVNAGTAYWLVLKPGSSPGSDIWDLSPFAMGEAAFTTDDDDWLRHSTGGPELSLPTFRITAQESNASSVPDASPSLVLLVIGLAALWGIRRVNGSQPRLCPAHGICANVLRQGG